MVAMAVYGPVRRPAQGLERRECPGVNPAMIAQEKLSQHSHFRGRADGFEFIQREDVLVVRGCVPTFYLKQVLQTALKDLDGIRWVDNQVNVTACDGLSSERDSL